MDGDEKGDTCAGKVFSVAKQHGHMSMCTASARGINGTSVSVQLPL
jgi:hypothetical protein